MSNFSRRGWLDEIYQGKVSCFCNTLLESQSLRLSAKYLNLKPWLNFMESLQHSIKIYLQSLFSTCVLFFSKNFWHDSWLYRKEKYNARISMRIERKCFSNVFFFHMYIFSNFIARFLKFTLCRWRHAASDFKVYRCNLRMIFISIIWVVSNTTTSISI